METIKKAIDRTHTELHYEHGYQEKHYQAVLAHFIRKALPAATVSLELNVAYKTSDGFAFFSGRMDIVVELPDDYIILELKANVDLARTKQASLGQVKRYMVHADTTKRITGALVVFGRMLPAVWYLTKHDKLIAVHKRLENLTTPVRA